MYAEDWGDFGGGEVVGVFCYGINLPEEYLSIAVTNRI